MWRRYANLQRIAQLDPVTDFDEIFRLVTSYEFPWDYTQGTSIAFLRDFAVPSISGVLDRTKQFEEHGQKRYDDTILIGYEATVETLESSRGRAAIRHLNNIHRHYDIPNDEFVYVLATTIVGPKQWIDRYGWRPLHPHEVESMCRVTTRFGELMGITGLPTSYAGYQRFLEDYEAAHFAFAPQNRQVAEATIAIFTGWYPRALRPVLRRGTIAMLDEPLRAALGLPRQPAWLAAAVEAALRLRGRVLRRLPPRPQTRPYVPRARSYPFGFTLADLGPVGPRLNPARADRPERA